MDAVSAELARLDRRVQELERFSGLDGGDPKVMTQALFASEMRTVNTSLEAIRRTLEQNDERQTWFQRILISMGVTVLGQLILTLARLL